MEKYILIYDIPKEMNALRNRVHRKLKKLKIEKLQDSVWSSENSEELEDVAKEIKRFGGIASVLETKKIF